MTISESDIQRAKNNIADTIGRYIPLKKHGANHIACCPFHEERTPSFTVSESKGFYYCFGCGSSGDAISFVSQYESKSFQESIETIIGQLSQSDRQPAKKPAKPRINWTPIIATSEPPSSAFEHYRLGFPSVTYPYRTIDNQLIGYVCRFETQEGKETLPLCLATSDDGRTEWRWLGFKIPRSMYGLETLSAYAPDAKILLVEGEKTAVAARSIFKINPVLSWTGGVNGIKNVDWSPLNGRHVIMWPDNDEPGINAMREIYGMIAASCMVVPPPGHGKGWDLADPMPDGFSPLAYAKAHMQDAAVFFPATDSPDQPEPATEMPEYPDPEPAPCETYFATPVDVFGTSQPASVPYDVMPPQIVDYVRDQSELLGCDPSIIAIGAIVSAAACIHDGIRLYPKRSDHTWHESARLWGAIVGSPSTRKSPGLSKAMRHVKRIDHDLAEENNTAAAAYKHQMNQWKDAVKKDAGIQEPVPPKPQRILVEDTTVEAMSEILKDNPRGILCYQDELTGWFASMDAYKSSGKGANKDRAHWLQAYNGGRHTVDRVTRGNLIIPNWSACVLGGIQPDVMRGLANGMGNDGLLQRFIVVVARPSVEDVDRVPNMTAINSYRDLFDSLIAILPSDERVRLSDEAHASRLRVSKYSLRMVDAFMGSPMESWLGKWDGLYARLLLTYHVIECSAMAVHPANRPVSCETAVRVERLLCGCLIHHAIYFYSEIVDTHSRQENIRQLARLILARKLNSISKRDLSNYWKASRRLEWHQIRDVTQNLCNMDWLAPDYNKIDTDGKPRAWVVNPQVHELFADQAEKEIERRREIVNTIKELREAYE